MRARAVRVQEACVPHGSAKYRAILNARASKRWRRKKKIDLHRLFARRAFVYVNIARA